MQTFTMMIGLPGSGKDYFIKNNMDEYCVISSDQVRAENGYGPGAIEDVFTICRSKIMESLSLGEDVVFNATNLRRKYRVALLNKIYEKFGRDIYYRGYLMVTPINLCKERNERRIGAEEVPEKVIDNMAKSFQIPLKGEGFDYIYFIKPNLEEFCYEDGLIKYKYISADYDDIYEFDQFNHHHTLSLGDHMDKACDYIEEHFQERIGMPISSKEFDLLTNTALFHDIGKLLTQDFHDKNGRPTKEAHYYGHENIGAYIMISEFPFFWNHNRKTEYDFKFFIKMATYINFHMRVNHVWKKYPKGKATRKDKKLLSDFDIKCLEFLGEADRAAH